MSKAWPQVRLGEVLTEVSLPEPVQTGVTYKLLGARWYALGLYIKKTCDGSMIRADKLYRVQEGNFIYNRLFAWKGSFAVADKDADGCYVSNEFPCFKANSGKLDARYLWKYLSREDAWTKALGLSTGATPTSRNRLKVHDFLGFGIPLPPLAEQQRIVARIDELSAQIEEAKALRKQAAAEAEALAHSTVRKLAYETVWETKRLPEVAQINPSRTGKVKLAPNDMVSFVPMKAVDEVTGTIAWPETRPFSEVAKGYTWFTEGDVIFARITPCMQNGKAAIARSLVNDTAFGSTEFHVIRPGPKVTSEWLHALVRHKAFRDDAAEHFKGTAGQQRVPQAFLEQKLIPIPPLAEQRRIVAELDALQAEVDILKRLQAETAAELDALLPSVLDRAFKGEL